LTHLGDNIWTTPSFDRSLPQPKPQKPSKLLEFMDSIPDRFGFCDEMD
jgi:hypothetical protein